MLYRRVKSNLVSYEHGICEVIASITKTALARMKQGTKKPSKWTVFKSSYRRLSDEEIVILEETEKVQNYGSQEKKESKKKKIKKASKRLKKATWSALKAIYQGFLYSSYQMAYSSSSMPGVDPMFLPHIRAPASVYATERYHYHSRY